jgi:hypothetical protein
MVDINNPAYKHGHASREKFSPTYYSWSCMLTRCNNKNRAMWKYYGGKGIVVCEKWQSFLGFLEDMGERPEGTSLDRIDSNSSNVVWVEIGEVKKRLVEWCEELKISINTVRARVKSQNMTYKEALTKSTKVDLVESARHMTRVREERRRQRNSE